MSASILVTFSSVYGSTQEVAGEMAAVLRQAGLQVDLQPARRVSGLAGYRAVVLGAPLYMLHWHKDALRFLSRHRQALAGLPVAVFALGPFHNTEEELHSAGEQLDKELAKYAWFKPVAVEAFTGKYDPATLRFPYNLIGPLKKIPASDERDWDAIRTWTRELVARFSVVES